MAKEFVGQEYMAATHGKGLHQHSKGMRIVGRTTIILSAVITVISVAMIACCLIFSICPISGTSMMTTMNATGKDTDSAITSYLGEPQRGDIVVYRLYLNQTHQANSELTEGLKTRYPHTDWHGNRYMLIVKRLIGKAGDKISMCRVGNNYYIYLNGEKLNEDYLDPLVAFPSAQNFIQLWNVLNDYSKADLQDWIATNYQSCISLNKYQADEGEASRLMLTVPDNCQFLMGDNRDGFRDGKYKYGPSWDSTYLGPLPKSNYVSLCVDIIDNTVSMPEYIWSKFVYYVCFGWAWQK